jgi:hypothetical protein
LRRWPDLIPNIKKRGLYMNNFRFALGLLAIMIFTSTFTSIAQAQATRTWVSGVGDDANPCSRTAPCKTFAGAIAKTASSGEISVLDPGGFGGVTITKSISIISNSIEAGILVSGTNAIIVNAPAGSNVVLDGLDIEGLGTGLDGVRILANNSVVVRRSRIHNFTGNGVDVVGPAGAKVLVQDCDISNNGGGVNVQGSGGAANTGVIDRTTIDTHTNFAVQSAQGGAAFLSASSLIGTGPKVVLSGNGTIATYGNNVIRGTSAALPAPLPLQ